MALNEIFAYSRQRTRERLVPSGTLPGAPLLINSRPCVALTARQDATKTFNIAGGVSHTYPIGSAGQAAGSATVAFDGTFEFTGITGVTTSTAQDTAIYITAGGALTTTSTANTLFGYVDNPRDYTAATGKAAVRIAQVN
jgi:hypothetical protein